jgi:hypothetical protein
MFRHYVTKLIYIIWKQQNKITALVKLGCVLRNLASAGRLICITTSGEHSLLFLLEQHWLGKAKYNYLKSNKWDY